MTLKAIIILIFVLLDGFATRSEPNTDSVSDCRFVTESQKVCEIKSIYDLGGETWVFPEGSVLRFDGGVIKNGILIGNNTIIEAMPVEIFGEGLVFEGTWEASVAYPEWFGAIPCAIEEASIYADINRKAIQKCVDVFTHTLFANGDVNKHYYVAPENGKDHIINITKRGRIIEGLDVDRTVIETLNDVNNTRVLYFSEPTKGARASDCIVQNLKIQHQDPKNFSNTGIYIEYRCTGLRLMGIHLENLDYCVVCESWNEILQRVKCYGNYGFVFKSKHGLRTSISLENCSIAYAKVGYTFSDLLYSRLSCCGADRCEKAFELNNCTSIVFSACGSEDNKCLMTVNSCNELSFNIDVILTKKVADEYAYSKAEFRKFCEIKGNSSYISFTNCTFNIHKPHSLEKYKDDDLALISVIRSYGNAPLVIYRECFGVLQETGTPVYNLICVDEWGGKYFERQSVILENSAFTSGSSSRRPCLSNLYIGYQYYDTTLNKPIWYKGNNVWVDAYGNYI